MGNPSSQPYKVQLSAREVYLIKRALGTDFGTLDRTLNSVGETPISDFHYKEMLKYWLDEKKDISNLLNKLEALPPP